MAAMLIGATIAFVLVAAAGAGFILSGGAARNRLR